MSSVSNSTGSSIQTEIHCASCQASLIDMDLKGGFVSWRCSDCGKVSVDDSQMTHQQRAIRFGKLSLMFGLLSLVFSFLTAIPALWFAYKSLTIPQSLYENRKGKIWSLAGIGLSGVFAPASACVIASFAMVSFMISQSSTLVEPTQVEAFKAELGRFELTDKWFPRKAQKNPTAKYVEYVVPEKPIAPGADDEQAIREARYIYHSSFKVIVFGQFFSPSTQQLISQLRMNAFGGIDLNQLDTQPVIEKWAINDDEVDVYQDKGTGSTGKHLFRFVAVYPIGSKKYAIVGVTEIDDDGNPKVSIDEFRRILESFKPAE